jgi:eukaryotic translation initiation factor 2-alpha kinase 1
MINKWSNFSLNRCTRNLLFALPFFIVHVLVSQFEYLLFSDMNDNNDTAPNRLIDDWSSSSSSSNNSKWENHTDDDDDVSSDDEEETIELVVTGTDCQQRTLHVPIQRAVPPSPPNILDTMGCCNSTTSSSSPSSSTSSQGDRLISCSEHQQQREHRNSDEETTRTEFSGCRTFPMHGMKQHQQLDRVLCTSDDIKQSTPMHPTFVTTTTTAAAAAAVTKINDESSEMVEAASSLLPIDQERQILLLMLLAQVCALHDPTPRTFTVHILELFERGILDRSSIHFLYDLGLVPQTLETSTMPQPVLSDQEGTTLYTSPIPVATPQLLLHLEGFQGTTTSDTIEFDGSNQRLDLVESDQFALIPSSVSTVRHNNQQYFLRQRSLEASAIRNSLQHQDQQHQKHYKSQSRDQKERHKYQDHTQHSNLPTSSWHVDEHPLSLSRYQREFNEIGLLAAGSFGQVFHAINKMDGREYAVKRVSFSAAGYSGDSVKQVVREVHCLAVCDHPNVVRYFTSWLEPSWMTGSTATGCSSSNDADESQSNSETGSYLKLLTDMQRIVTSECGSSANLSDVFKSYFHDSACFDQRRQHRRRSSLDSSIFDNESIDKFADLHHDDCQECTISNSRDDIFIDGYRPRRHPKRSSTGIFGSNTQFLNSKSNLTDEVPLLPIHHVNRSPIYEYQISLYIQMQLCHPLTLADWIRTRNQERDTQTVHDRLDVTAEIFAQIVKGLHHVHECNIIHRDLKPSNVFASADGLNFKIGDFGLSKLIQYTSSPKSSSSSSANKFSHAQQRIRLQHLLRPDCSNEPRTTTAEKRRVDSSFEGRWEDPHMTAGVGTASYAAPEQVVTQTYGTSADIFSLGLILLELVCCFSTEHERLQTFYDCRHRRTLPAELDSLPVLSRMILACTESKASTRPTATELQLVNLRGETQHSQDKTQTMDLQPGDTLVVDVDDLTAKLKQSLAEKERELAEKEQRLHEYRLELDRKDQIISQLRRQVNK